MWEAFKDLIFAAIQGVHGFCGDWGLAIIIVTIIFRIIMTPIMHKQTKSSYAMSKLQPEIQRIKDRFPDDPRRQQEETQKLYASTKFNPVVGCVPMIIQIPIFMALFQTLREMVDRVADVSEYTFFNIIPNLTWTPPDALAQGVGTFVPYLILMVIFAGATFIPMILQQRDTGNAQQKRQMYIMAAVMSIMMLWISWSSPAGVLLFWVVSSILAIIQMQVSRRILKKRDAEAAAATPEYVRPVEVDVTRKPKKKRQSKKR